MGNDRTQVKFTVDKFNTRLDIILVVDPEHQSRLVETFFIITRYLHFSFKLTTVGGIIERRIIDRKPIMGYAPVIALRRDEHRQRLILNIPLFRFVEPLHLFQRLC